MRIALIDGDIVVYRAAASAEHEEEFVAIARVKSTMETILEQINADSYRCFVGHDENFRKTIDPNYKANRKDLPKPRWLLSCKDYLASDWNSESSFGLEGDDLLGINQTEETIICSIDKDLMQIPGYHWNWVNGTETYITPFQGIYRFYIQMLCGDRTDNIGGFDGIMRNIVPKFIKDILSHCHDNEEEMFDTVRELYKDDVRMLRNGKLLHILQQEGAIWTHHKLPESLLTGKDSSEQEEVLE